ncbi:hypothetical protein [Paenibacillus sp. SYP-B4298]|uniref:hypothetical protein n=1 Tax=Paenibacillus sp. SYP-B4298 TaxID=2996034 RepID=UPI0022DDAF80|nr:hypothetical protein [Paenibacillus sp. SYP-B4298]
MKNSNLLIAGLILIICFLIYQVFDLKQEIWSVENSRPPVVVPNGFSIYGQVSGTSNEDGFWVYKDDEKIVYFFNYDPETKEITKIQTSIYDQ